MPDPIFQLGTYRAFVTKRPEQIMRAQKMRARMFGCVGPLDIDEFDTACEHVLIEHLETGALVCSFRFMHLQMDDLAQCYSSQFYDLSGIAASGGRAIELGRFCAQGAREDPDILRLALAVIARLVDTAKAGMLFGCTSFAGVEPDNYSAAFGNLALRHLAPGNLRLRAKSTDTVSLVQYAPMGQDVSRALREMPALLRSYLALGGRVSDHAVIDQEMNTIHVFTIVNVAGIPKQREQSLRAVAERLEISTTVQT